MHVRREGVIHDSVSLAMESSVSNRSKQSTYEMIVLLALCAIGRHEKYSVSSISIITRNG
jgi:hypothetical protein